MSRSPKKQCEPAAVYTVDVPERDDGLHVFVDHGAAGAFADAVSDPDAPFLVGVDDPPVNHGEGAENLIAVERGARLEDLGYPISAEEVRERKQTLASILMSFEASPEGEGEEGRRAKGLLCRWIDLDKERGTLSRVELVMADGEVCSEPAYTVFGIYLEPVSPCPLQREHQPYATTVYTRNGPGAAADIAQRVCREHNAAEGSDDLLQIVAVVAGEVDALDA